MPACWRSRGTLVCFLLFFLVYIFLNIDIAHTSGTLCSGYRMLLFVFPGVLASTFSRNDRILSALIGAILAVPASLAFSHFSLNIQLDFWQEVAYVTSAIFWCVSGALFFQFINFLTQKTRRV